MSILSTHMLQVQKSSASPRFNMKATMIAIIIGWTIGGRVDQNWSARKVIPPSSIPTSRRLNLGVLMRSEMASGLSHPFITKPKSWFIQSCSNSHKTNFVGVLDDNLLYPIINTSSNFKPSMLDILMHTRPDLDLQMCRDTYLSMYLTTLGDGSKHATSKVTLCTLVTQMECFEFGSPTKYTSKNMSHGIYFHYNPYNPYGSNEFPLMILCIHKIHFSQHDWAICSHPFVNIAL